MASRSGLSGCEVDCLIRHSARFGGFISVAFIFSNKSRKYIDKDRDGSVTKEEFVLGVYIIDLLLSGTSLDSIINKYR